jgi:hypothetical protein
MTSQKGSKLPAGCEEEAMAAMKTMRKIIQDEDDAFQRLGHFFPHSSVHSATGALLKPGRSRPVVLYGWAKTMAALLNTEKECKMYYGMTKGMKDELQHSENMRVSIHEENLRLKRLYCPDELTGWEEEEKETGELSDEINSEPKTVTDSEDKTANNSEEDSKVAINATKAGEPSTAPAIQGAEPGAGAPVVDLTTPPPTIIPTPTNPDPNAVPFVTVTSKDKKAKKAKKAADKAAAAAAAATAATATAGTPPTAPAAGTAVIAPKDRKAKIPGQSYCGWIWKHMRCRETGKCPFKHPKLCPDPKCNPRKQEKCVQGFHGHRKLTKSQKNNPPTAPTSGNSSGAPNPSGSASHLTSTDWAQVKKIAQQSYAQEQQQKQQLLQQQQQAPMVQQQQPPVPLMTALSFPALPPPQRMALAPQMGPSPVTSSFVAAAPQQVVVAAPRSAEERLELLLNSLQSSINHVRSA